MGNLPVGLSVWASGRVALSEAKSKGVSKEVSKGWLLGWLSGHVACSEGWFKGGFRKRSFGGLREGSERVSRSGFGNTWHSPKGSEGGLPGWHVPKGFFEGVFRDGFRRWIRDRRLGFHRLDRTGVS